MQVVFFDYAFRHYILPGGYIIISSGDDMVIYVDILVFTNAVVDYILLCITSLIVRREYALKRMIPAAIAGGLSSLYILVETDMPLTDVIYKVISGAVILLIALGLKDIKAFAYSYAVLMGLSFLLNGLVVFAAGIGADTVFLSENMVNYINVSPIYLIGATVVVYFAVRLMQRVSDRRTKTPSAELCIDVCDRYCRFTALVDTGHSVSDPFGDSMVFIVDNARFSEIADSMEPDDLKRRTRVIPVKTVNGFCALEALRCDSADVLADKRNYKFSKPIIAASKDTIENGFDAIIPRTCIDRYPD